MEKVLTYFFLHFKRLPAEGVLGHWFCSSGRACNADSVQQGELRSNLSCFKFETVIVNSGQRFLYMKQPFSVLSCIFNV